MYAIGQIFREAEVELSGEDDINSRRPPIMQVQCFYVFKHLFRSSIPVDIDPYVSNMLDAFFLLAAEQSERLAFIQHFHMNLDYKAQALIQTVKGQHLLLRPVCLFV